MTNDKLIFLTFVFGVLFDIGYLSFAIINFMLSNNFLLYSGQILIELAYDILYFPLWWYSRGLAQVIRGLKNFLTNRQRSLALFVWVKNIFRPMYGQEDWGGVLISFFVRVFQIIIRSVFMLWWLILAAAVFCFWLILPLLTIYEILFQTVL